MVKGAGTQKKKKKKVQMQFLIPQFTKSNTEAN